jgi:hypothetical protein
MRDTCICESPTRSPIALGQVVTEPEREDLLVARGERAHDLVEGQTVLGAPVAGVGAPDKVAARRVRSVDPDRSVERLGSIGPIGLQRVPVA